MLHFAEYILMEELTPKVIQVCLTSVGEKMFNDMNTN